MARDDPDFREFFAGEFWPLRRVGFLLTGDWDQAEELAQEAMARTYAVWPRVRGYDRPAAYARKVLLNRHRSLLRRAVVEARHLLTSHPDDRHQPDFGGDDLVLWQALQGLPSRQRAALVLRFYLDLPEAEVARLLGVPAGTVKSWTHRGLARLRDRLGPTYADERLAGNPSTEAGNFHFRYPPGWEARRIGGQWALTLRGIPRSDQGVPEFEVRVTSARSLWRSQGYWQGTAPEVGRLPAGQAYLLTSHAPAEYGTYVVDWGRGCVKPAAPGSCRPRSVQVEFRSFTGRPSWDRYRAEVQTVVGTLEKLRPTAPTVGDRTRPACRAEQWELVPPDVIGTTQGDPVVAVPVGVGFRGGRPCHLRAPVSMAALQDGRLLEVRGNPAPVTIELDLPEDALPATYRGADEDRMLQTWVWNRPCKSPRPPARPVTFRRVDLVFSDERGRRLLATHFNQGPETGVCGERGRPSVLAPWP